MPDRARYARERAAAGALGTTPFKLRVARVRRERPGTSAAAAAGHAARTGETSLSRLPPIARTASFGVRTSEGGAEVITVEGVTALQQQRAGYWWRDATALRDGRLSPRAFRQAWRHRAPIDGHRLLSDPRLAIALLATLVPGDIEFDGPGPQYRRRRSRRSTR